VAKLFALFVVIALASGASWLANHAGEFELEWFGWQVSGSATFLAIALFFAAALIWLLMHWLNALLKLPADLRKERNHLMNAKGLEEVTKALIASSDGDGEAAKKYLKRANQFLPDSPLPQLMQLQLAGKTADSALAQKQFAKLQHFDSTKALGLRGLAEQARLSGKMDEALRHVEALLKEAPNQAATQRLAVDLLSYHRRWQEAEKTLKQSYAASNITKDQFQRAQATIALQQAQLMLEESNRQGAMEMLKKATSADISLQPATIKYAELLKQIGKSNQAIKLIRKAWKYAPHPDLATLHAECYSELSEEKQRRKMQDLAKQNPESVESDALLAKAAMDAENWDEAKNHLKVALSKQQRVGLCRMMAELYKKGFADEEAERKWLDKAVVAVDDPTWQCNSCHQQHDSWDAHCSNCHDFASIHWLPQRPLALAAA
jgi:HemY protein